MRGTGRALLAATLLLIAGTLNIIYGIGALDGANAFVSDQRYVLTDRPQHAGGWVLIVLRDPVIGIIGGSVGAIGALLAIGGNYPWWSLAILFFCV